jgi:hypothetical protein
VGCWRQASASPAFDRDREPLEALAASAREQGKADDLLTIQTDLTSDAATEEITRATRARISSKNRRSSSRNLLERRLQRRNDRLLSYLT